MELTLDKLLKAAVPNAADVKALEAKQEEYDKLYELKKEDDKAYEEARKVFEKTSKPHYKFQDKFYEVKRELEELKEKSSTIKIQIVASA